MERARRDRLTVVAMQAELAQEQALTPHQLPASRSLLRHWLVSTSARPLPALMRHSCSWLLVLAVALLLLICPAAGANPGRDKLGKYHAR